MYALVRSGGIVQYLNELPFSFNGVKAFRSLTPEQRAAHGILPVVDLTPPLDPALERLAKAPLAVTIYPDRVEIVRAIEPLTKEVADARAAEQQAAGVEAKRLAALRAMDEQRLATAVLDLDAPQAVKDYDAAVKVVL